MALADDLLSVAPLEFVSSTEVRCVAPAARPDDVLHVHVSNDGVWYSPTGLPLSYLQNPSLMSIVPTSGPTLGGTIVSI